MGLWIRLLWLVHNSRDVLRLVPLRRPQYQSIDILLHEKAADLVSCRGVEGGSNWGASLDVDVVEGHMPWPRERLLRIAVGWDVEKCILEMRWSVRRLFGEVLLIHLLTIVTKPIAISLQ